MKRLFITSSGTGIGKTVVTTALCWQMRQAATPVTAIKPVISGFDPSDLTNDTAMILKSSGVKTPTLQLMQAISPWRYKAPLAPNMAAEKEGNPVDVGALVMFCRGCAEDNSDLVVVEGVGGVMAPLNNKQTVLDWMQALSWPAVIVAGSYLGSISHTLTAVEAVVARGIKVAGVVVSDSGDANGQTPVALDATLSTLEKFLPKTIALLSIPKLDPSQEIWTQVPSLSRLCDV
jgi:dethiobiotin synthetase